MTEKIPARVYADLAPGGLLLLGLSWAILRAQALPGSATEFIRYAQFAVFAVGLILSALFHRSRIFHALGLLLLCNVALLLTGGRLTTPMSDVLTRIVALVLPLHLVLIGFLPETGIASRNGLVRIGIFAFEAVALASVVKYYAATALYYLNWPLVYIPQWRGFHGMADSVLAVFAICMLLLMLQMVHRRFRPTDIGLYWALISGFVAFCVAGSVRLMSLAFTVGATALVIALLEAFYAMAYFDELTELPSRRSFNDAKLRLGSRYTVAMVDVDHFKKFNDTFGHAAGDQVLRMVASRIAQVTGGGKGYRYGGEEFALIFPGKYVDEVFPHLERLRRSVEELPFKLRGIDRRKKRLSLRRRPAKQQASISVSIGVAGADGDKRKPDDLVRAADQALYIAKSSGRNCTVTATQIR